MLSLEIASNKLTCLCLSTTSYGIVVLGAVILLGKTNMFRFNHPAEAAKLRQKYASVENLSSIVPSKELEARSYLFYNAGYVNDVAHSIWMS